VRRDIAARGACGGGAAAFVDEPLPLCVLAPQLALHDAPFVEEPVERVAVAVGMGLGELGVDLAETHFGAQDGRLHAAQARASPPRFFGGLLGLPRLGSAGGSRVAARRRDGSGGLSGSREARGAGLPVPARREVVEQSAVVDLEHARGHAVDEVAIVGHQQDGAGVVLERVRERLH